MRRLLAAVLAVVPLCAGAILIRADRDDAEYLELANKYAPSVALPDGEGVLVAPRWILTAGHVARAMQEMKALPKIPIGGRDYEIQSLRIHPDWTKSYPAADIALIYLKRAVPEDLQPAGLYRGKDEGGKTVVIIGHGYTGRIGGKPLPKEQWDKKKRAAINTVDRVSPRTLGLLVKPPDEASDLQGAAAPGDGGGPAFFEAPDGLQVMGIGSTTEDTNANGIVGDAGDWEIYVRVSSFAKWIDAVIDETSQQELNDLLDASGRS